MAYNVIMRVCFYVAFLLLVRSTGGTDGTTRDAQKALPIDTSTVLLGSTSVV